jgi:hypothetical protein
LPIDAVVIVTRLSVMGSDSARAEETRLNGFGGYIPSLANETGLTAAMQLDQARRAYQHSPPPSLVFVVY